MAKRKVFTSKGGYTDMVVEFKWHPGISKAQKQMNVMELHNIIESKYPELKVLEVSSKSLTELGVNLSAFNLHNQHGISVESLFQGSKVFQFGGPYQDLYSKPSMVAKTDERLKNSGALIGFKLGGIEFPVEPLGYFYNWLYISTLLKNPGLINELAEYDTFTDIEANPDKIKSCQAQAVAIFKVLKNFNLLDKAMASKESFMNFTPKNN